MAGNFGNGTHEASGFEVVALCVHYRGDWHYRVADVKAKLETFDRSGSDQALELRG